ncbi:MAG: LLM class flavin-dependent oxidoreductase [Chloroflexi bacterium]|nr:LLM class flavin-dependent oxidoreductase [Chloroflexota bacterium]
MARLELGVFLDLATESRTLGEHMTTWQPLLERAEALGFTSVWAGESYPRGGGGFQHAPDPLLVLAALSRVTRMRLGTGVLLLPVWDTLKLAYDTIVLDQLSDGRLELGVGLGAAPTWKQFGVDPATIGARVDEQIVALRALWAGEASFSGAYVSFDGAIGPRPVQPGGPPIWVGGKIGRSARRAAELGDGYLAGTHFGLGLVRTQVERYRAALATGGRGPGRVAVNRIVVLADDAEQAWAEGGPSIERLLRMYAKLKMFKGADELAAAPAGDMDAVRQAAAGMCLVGTPESVAAELGAYLELGIDQIQLRPAPGGMPAAVAARTLELAGSRLLPLLEG